jgi:hypothetical protein
MTTDNLVGVDRPMREEAGLHGSQEDDRDDRRPALPFGLQGLDLCNETIHGLPLSYVPHDAARIRLRTGGFPRAVLKATAASQRDLSTICNIIVRSRVRFPKLPRFNVGEQDNTQDIEFDLCSWDKPRQLTMFRGPTRRRTSLYCDDQLTTPATHTQRLEPLSHFILFQQRTPAKVRDMLSSNSSTATKNV